jgi:chloramphenicol 3-O phosphotransferase
MSGIAATVRTGANVILEEAFLGGADSQRRWHDAFAGVQVLWAGVHGDPVAAAQRELGRSERIPRMAVSRAHMVRERVTYDIEAGTTRTDATACAHDIDRMPADDGVIGSAGG